MSSSSTKNINNNDKIRRKQEKNVVITKLRRKKKKPKQKLKEIKLQNSAYTVKLTKEISLLRKEVQSKENQVIALKRKLEDIEKVHMKSTIQSLKLNESLNDIHKIQVHQKKMSKFMEEVVTNIEEVLHLSKTDIVIGDYVYFEAGIHNYPLGIVKHINNESEEERFTVEHGDAIYNVSKHQIYKTDGKLKKNVPEDMNNYNIY